jgi:DNA polymerase III epsilon subunit-like protein
MDYSPNTPLNELTFTVLDFETTGTVKGFISRPWQLGAVLVRGTQLSLTEGCFDTLLRVPEDYPFSKYAPGTYAAQRAAIATAPDILTVWPALHAQLSCTIPVAHNAATERTQLARLAPMTRYPHWVDTLTLSRKIYPSLTSFALDDLIPALGLTPQLQQLVPNRAPHDAYYDAVACALLLIHILSLPGWSTLTLGDLQTL